MFYKFRSILPFLILILLTVTGLAIDSFPNGKKPVSFGKILLSTIGRSTGAASVYYEDGKPAEFVGHHLNGLKYPNALYQGFIAIHFDEMDSVLTKHSTVGRTNAKNSPGDKNTFHWISGKSFENSQISIDTITFSMNNISYRFLVHQIIETKKDSSHAIFLTYIFEFIKPAGDTAVFSNMKILFGYDGDIGNSLGGFGDDSSGYHEDDSTAVVYVFDDSLNLYSGVGLIDKQPNAVAGNYALLHQTANREGANNKSLDTLLYKLMSQPTFSSSLPRTDVSVYWSIDLGTITPLDTIRDTIRFVLLNGSTKNSLIQAAKGNKIVYNTTEIVSANKVPSNIFLHPNYPNPFNPETTIKYDLNREVFVSLKIYNLLGQEVRNLFQGKQGAGSHSALWDGRDKRGNELSSGIYIYRLKTERSIQSRKMILLK